MENQTKEIRRLQNCINDLVSLLALPAICNGRDASDIIGALLNVLPGMLRLDFVYARLNVPAGVPPVERLRVAERRETTPQPQEVGRALEPWLTPDTPTGARCFRSGFRRCENERRTFHFLCDTSPRATRVNSTSL